MGRVTNSKSIYSLTLGILSIIVPYIGLILGIIGLIFASKSIKEIESYKQEGRGLATSGKVCSIVGICLQVLLLLLLAISISVYFLTNTSP
ncbi:DUF4190 domain-containing protein [Bacillus sp. B1-b2]|uniref:DUF4190 domain-containing protein n=1 Tax=Bacillus sp. B1-b2 TaxID=2653201 RepID=UPI001261B984|nr:DUF4190 domain-containing protein [Bacillus sp. B1-b2]KAB7672048.1 DUF4190 domain-containing protein [Bacillus sp. B1-b2]